MPSQMLVFLLHIIPAKDRKILVEFLAQQNTHYAQNYAGVIYASLPTRKERKMYFVACMSAPPLCRECT